MGGHDLCRQMYWTTLRQLGFSKKDHEDISTLHSLKQQWFVEWPERNYREYKSGCCAWSVRMDALIDVKTREEENDGR